MNSKWSHYTYVVWKEDTGEYYIGVRSCEGDPKDDIHYKGSMVTWKLNSFEKRDLKKKILGIYATREEAEFMESLMIEEHAFNPLNRNYHIPGDGYVPHYLKFE